MNLFQEKKPSLMNRTRNFLKKKWVNAAGGVILASALTMGAAPRINAQQLEPAVNPVVQFDYNQIQDNARFVGVTAGDHDYSRNLDFVLEDYSLADKNNNPFKLWVHEDFDWTNKKVLDEVIKRINNPDKYPLIEAYGTYHPVTSQGGFDGRLNLESIITTDLEGNSETFFTDPANSNFYQIESDDFLDWAFLPGRNIMGVYYPYFGVGPAWDIDGDGIPNRFDPSPFYWDPWDPFIFNPLFALDRWHNQGWFGWNYWNYWGGPGLYIDIDIFHDHHGNPVHRNDFLRTITRDQLKDPNFGPDAVDNMKRLQENLEAHRIVLTNDQLQNRKQYVDQVKKNIYDMLRNNPNVRIRDPDGNERIIKVNPSDYNPENQGRFTRNGERGQPGITTTIAPERAREGTGTPNYTGKTERNTEKNAGSGKTVERKTERSTEKNPPAPRVMKEPTKTSGEKPVKKEGSTSGEIKKKYEASSSIDGLVREYDSNTPARTEYSPRSTATNYPSRLIRPTPSQVQQYGSPNTRAPSTYSSPRNYSTPKSSGNYKPSTIRSSPSSSRSSGSYRLPSSTRSSGSSYRGSSGSRSSGSSGSVRKK
jgi:hypothetical protein